MSTAVRTAREVVELYNLELWNNRKFDLADELIADTMIRHEVGESQTLTREQALKRVTDTWAEFDHIQFDLNIVVASAEGEHVTIVYDSLLSKGENESELPASRCSASSTGRSSKSGTAATSWESGADRPRARRTGLLPSGRRRR